jgi:hypothetical protein
VSCSTTHIERVPDDGNARAKLYRLEEANLVGNVHERVATTNHGIGGETLPKAETRCFHVHEVLEGTGYGAWRA